MLKKVLKMFNQTLLTATAGNSTSNLDSNNVPHDNILDRQPASTLLTNNIKKQTISPQKDSYRLDPANHIRTDPLPNFERTKQIIMVIDGLLHIPKLCNKILWH